MNFFKKAKTSSESVCPPTPQGKWFGHPLPEICQGGALPKPVMTLLETLFHDGPYTSGIFRKPANEKKKREFIELMDQNDDCSTADVPVMVVSSTFKEFLRQMPDCLLTSELYSDWLDTTTVQDPDERIAKVKRLVERLPASHACLLRHLVCVLRRVASLAAPHNHMTAYNLAVCTAPSLLWLRAGGDVDGLDKLPLLVQHMIEQCEAIFGEEVLTLFGPPHPRDEDGGEEGAGAGEEEEAPAAPSKQRDSSTDSDSMHSLLSLHDAHTGVAGHRDNSSIDSMGGSEIESSPRVPKSHLSPTNLSRDSGLYSSDNQLYEDSNAESEVAQHHQQQQQHPQLQKVSMRKPSITRSVSQFDEPSSSDMLEERGGRSVATTNAMTRSYDGVLDSVSVGGTSGTGNTLPVPPPRKHRGSGGTDPIPAYGSGASGTTGTKSTPPQTVPPPTMRPCASTSELRRHKYTYGQKRASTEFLGSVEEYPGTEAPSFPVPRRQDLGTLHKSDSGARLYINEDVVNSAMYTDPVDGGERGGQGARPQQRCHELRRERTEKSSSLPPPLRRSWTEDSTTTTTSTSNVTASSAPGVSFMPKATDSELTEQDRMEVREVREVRSEGRDSRDSVDARREVREVRSEGRDVRDSRDNAEAQRVSDVRTVERSTKSTPSNVPKPPETIAVIQVPKGSLAFAPQRSEPVVQRRRAGMTEKGADIFPSHINRALVQPDRSFVAEMPRCAQLVRALNLESGVQKSSGAMSSSRPDHPPSYQEALRRKSQLNMSEKEQEESRRKAEYRKSHIPEKEQEALRRKSLGMTEKAQELQYSDIDAWDQKNRCELAKYLYNKSVAMYSAAIEKEGDSKGKESGEKEEPRPNQPPSYEQAVQRAEQIKRQSSPMRDTTTPTGSVKKVSRVRRHGHRASDTKLESESARSSSFTTGHKVTRSKSDSSEHLHKLTARIQVTESTDSEDEWPAVQRRLRASKSVERVPSKDKLSEVKVKARPQQQQRGGYDSGSDSTTETTTTKTRTRIQSLRNRDWHKELSEAYSQCFYQPPEATEPKYAYVRPTPKEERTVDRQRRKSWVPPVHPTRDLIQVDYAKDYNKDYAKDYAPKDYSKDYTLTSSHPGVVLATRSEPVSPVKQAIVRPVKQTAPLTAPNVSSDSGKSTGKSSLNDSDSDGGFKETGISWSVKKLRNIYGGAEVNKDTSKNTSKDTKKDTNKDSRAPKHAAHFYTGPESEPPPRRNPVREKTNSNADKAYL